MAKTRRECTEIKASSKRGKQQESTDFNTWFADASQLAVCAAVYVLVTYNDGKTCHNLLVSKSRVAPKKVSIPSLELVAAHTLAKLLGHVNHSLSSLDILKENQLWSDSLTVLYWLANMGTSSMYVRNRVKAIHDLGNFTWD
ncbi:Hypothetical predicted protein [Paramuricea clavata]|uniref:Uncharacterized protein n=1 Tax=Paramuricea clavata TaxID=317549 RepID=A0A6S7IUT7_PARCT|nr:Hypothetical predicted protein [Paramuricea clavata]